MTMVVRHVDWYGMAWFVPLQIAPALSATMNSPNKSRTVAVPDGGSSAGAELYGAKAGSDGGSKTWHHPSELHVVFARDRGQMMQYFSRSRNAPSEFIIVYKCGGFKEGTLWYT
ncbi:hypothetical protein P154DRAFT_311403 [Amniculicola lignicola CBS 123094]|uniref:Uncharacterized protein n=1 Tax=Amniculicola lignicola CBS 123094 TaxID=1392246 RepID=A0A6A5W8U3_9PLEO|nr:hypothetical protein P154DRAFT_311403 [Amniculicola lignicola CBS 123094]